MERDNVREDIPVVPILCVAVLLCIAGMAVGIIFILAWMH